MFLYQWVWLCCLIWTGSKHLYFLELSNSAGEGRLWFKGVVMYVRIAWCRSSPTSMAFVRLFFIVCTKHSAWPLDCAFVGDVTVCYIPHVLVKSLSSCEVNCVLPSETMHLGIPISVKMSFKCLITLTEWRLCSCIMTGNRLK